MQRKSLLMLVLTLILSAIVSAQDDNIPREIEDLALNGVENNDDWEPYLQTFGDVEMVLVPAGCFTMGSTDDQIDYAIQLYGPGADSDYADMISDEQPAHEVCFDQPFWIDRFEVTNEQYGSLGCDKYSSEPNQPRNCISWTEAKDFCELREARLPTEAEWAYAARGPDSLVHTWGNEFIEGIAVNLIDPDETAVVGSKPESVSWVGTHDMNGNLWEWVSTIYDRDEFPLPYRADDGREDLEQARASRVVRDSGVDSRYGNYMRISYRAGMRPRFKNERIGFRCARSE